jgi:putative ABC transport system permease protein
MLRPALRSLVHERGKLVAAVAGVAFAASLALAQTGLYVGFRAMATAIIGRVGGDLWVMARGTQLLDFADTLAPAARSAATAHPCVDSARGVVFSWATVRKPSGGVDNVQILGFERPGARVLPWSLDRGLPSDLHAPMRVALDQADLPTLEVPADAIGAPLEINDHTAYVGAVTKGIKSFTVVPYLFAEAKSAQRITGMGADEYTYWALDLRDPRCAADVARSIERNPDLQVRTAGEFREMTADYWILRSGAGGTLGFSALLSLVVGAVVVGQTLFALTEARLRELATFKAMGATNAELLTYVAWQATALAVAGGSIGTVLAVMMSAGVRSAGVVMSLSPAVFAIGYSCIAVMCAVASIASVRKVLSVSAAEVFK